MPITPEQQKYRDEIFDHSTTKTIRVIYEDMDNPGTYLSYCYGKAPIEEWNREVRQAKESQNWIIKRANVQIIRVEYLEISLGDDPDKPVPMIKILKSLDLRRPGKLEVVDNQ